MQYVRKCRICDIKFPSAPEFSKCRVCDTVTASLIGTPDSDWEAKVTALLGPTDEEVNDPIVRWRYQELSKEGFEPAAALELASNRKVDIRYISERLIARGCSPDLAYQISS